MNIDDSDVNWCSLLYNFSLLPSGTNSSQITILFFILKVLEIIFAVCIAELRGLVRMTSKVVLNLFIDFAILVISFLPFSVRPEFPLLTLDPRLKPAIFADSPCLNKYNSNQNYDSAYLFRVYTTITSVFSSYFLLSSCFSYPFPYYSASYLSYLS